MKLAPLDSHGPGRGALWQPVLSVLACKESPGWGAKEKAALRSLLADRQWPQVRVHKAGYSETSTCQLCADLTNGHHVGSLWHRLRCPALASFREEYMPAWLARHITNDRHDVDSVLGLSLTRGLFPAPGVPERRPEVYNTFVWHTVCDDFFLAVTFTLTAPFLTGS